MNVTIEVRHDDGSVQVETRAYRRTLRESRAETARRLLDDAVAQVTRALDATFTEAPR